MITELLFTRNNQAFKVLQGIDEVTGEAPNLMIPQHTHPVKQQPFDLVLKSITVNCDTKQGGRGTPIEMVATWEERQYDNAGNLIASYVKKESHNLIREEVQEFTAMFLPMLQPSIYNGAVRGGQSEHSIFLGQTDEPLFLADGSVNTIAITDKAPVYKYGVTDEVAPE
jgi:hypothetical protein